MNQTNFLFNNPAGPCCRYSHFPVKGNLGWSKPLPKKEGAVREPLIPMSPFIWTSAAHAPRTIGSKKNKKWMRFFPPVSK
jgi:hypothetical protein